MCFESPSNRVTCRLSTLSHNRDRQTTERIEPASKGVTRQEVRVRYMRLAHLAEPMRAFDNPYPADSAAAAPASDADVARSAALHGHEHALPVRAWNGAASHDFHAIRAHTDYPPASRARRAANAGPPPPKCTAGTPHTSKRN